MIDHIVSVMQNGQEKRYHLEQHDQRIDKGLGGKQAAPHGNGMDRQIDECGRGERSGDHGEEDISSIPCAG